MLEPTLNILSIRQCDEHPHIYEAEIEMEGYRATGRGCSRTLAAFRAEKMIKRGDGIPVDFVGEIETFLSTI